MVCMKIDGKNAQSLNALTFRLELKYRLSRAQYYKVKAAIAPYMKKDFFTSRSGSGKYFVRSLYYDTHDHELYNHKMDGDSERVKFRIRTYSSHADCDTMIRVEIKIRRGNSTEKYSERISKQEYDCFVSRKRWDRCCENFVLTEFQRCMHLKTLWPKLLIDYEREGYRDRAVEGLRLTFDHKVRSVQAATLFPGQKVFFRTHHPEQTILEIKCGHRRPDWIQEIVRVHGLRVVANSKFTQAVELARHDLYHPDGLVIVR